MLRHTPVEALEARIAPASLVPVISADGKSATFIDVDGDVFSVTTSKGTFTEANFVYVGDSMTGQGYLQKIDLGFSMFGKIFQGAKITVTVDQPVGNGLADVGFINAAGIDLKQAAVDGDLVRIDVGDANFKTPAVKLLQAGQLGFHTPTDAGVADFISKVTGKINVLDIGTWADASILVSGGLTEKTAKFGTIGRASIVTMSGSDIAESAVLRTTGGIGTLVVQGELSGGSADNTGAIFAGGKIGSLTVGGAIVGGSGKSSGAIFSLDGLGTVNVGGNIQGGTNEFAGGIFAGKLKSLTIGGDLEAGSAHMSGSVSVESAKAITVTGNLIGGPQISGLFVESTVRRLTLGGTDGADGPATVVAGGPLKGGTAIVQLTVTGSLAGARILAGYDSELALVNPNAGIGKISIEGDLIASDIVAGIDGVNGVFGDSDDQVSSTDLKPKYLSSIGSLVVAGTVEGTDGGTDQHGILAEKIGSVRIAGVPLTLGKKTIDDLPLGTFGDYRLREIIAVS